MFGRYACVRQHDQSDCGAAALATIALHHRRPLQLQEVRDLAGTDRIGTNLLGLAAAAEKLGFSAKGVRASPEAIRHLPLPAIAHWTTDERLGHFIVVYRVSRKHVVIADPALGLRKLDREVFLRHWTGRLLLLTPREDAPAARTAMKPTRRFLELLRPHARILAEAFVCGLLLTILGLSTSFFIQHLVDSVLVHAQARLLNALAVGMLCLIVFRCLFGALRQVLLVHVGRKVDLGLISGYARHVLRQPARFFEMRRVGEILSRVNDALKVRQAVGGTALGAMVDATLVTVVMTVLFLYDWKLGLIAGAFIPVLLAIVAAHHPRSRRLSRQSMEAAAGLQAHLVEDVSGFDTVKTLVAEEKRSDEADERLVRLTRSVSSLQLVQAGTGALSMFVAAAAGIVVLWYGGHRVMDGALSVGGLMFFYSLLGMMLQPLERLASVNLQMQEALVALDRLYEILDLETETLEAAGSAEFRQVRRGIALEGVSFQYGCRDEVLIRVDLEIPAGSTVAIVGESGSGKTTLLKLLLRLYDPKEGRITIDGIDLRDISLASLRSRIGFVSQEPFLFTATIRDNIAFGRPEATQQEVADAARMAGLDGFISGLPQRFDTMIGERGANLSGGQRQRLAIARALLAKPEILIFDEATSHLDTETERAMQRSLKGAFAGKTVVLVAHRLSTIREADLIYVLSQGRVVERGPHAMLLALGGRYSRLYRSQSMEGPFTQVVAPHNGEVFRA